MSLKLVWALAAAIIGGINVSSGYYILESAKKFGKGYRLYWKTLDWTSAREYCLDQGMDLVRIETAKEKRWFATEFIREAWREWSAGTWIGLKDGVWVVDGSTDLPGNWPSIDGDGCGYIYSVDGYFVVSETFYDTPHCDDQPLSWYADRRWRGFVCAHECNSIPRCSVRTCADDPMQKCRQTQYLVDPLKHGRDSCQDVSCHMCGDESLCVKNCDRYNNENKGWYDRVDDCALYCKRMSRQSPYMCFHDNFVLECPVECSSDVCASGPKTHCSLKESSIFNAYASECLDTCGSDDTQRVLLQCDQCGTQDECVQACQGMNLAGIDCDSECLAIGGDFKCWNDFDCI